MNIKKITVPIYGDTTFRGSCPVEDADSASFVQWVKYQHPKYAKVISHIKNEGKRTFGQAARDKSIGLTKGFADIVVLSSPPFVCEMKRKDHTKSKIDADQISHLESASNLGCFACVAVGFDGAKLAFNKYLKEVNHAK